MGDIGHAQGSSQGALAVHSTEDLPPFCKGQKEIADAYDESSLRFAEGAGPYLAGLVIAQVAPSRYLTLWNSVLAVAC